MYHQEYYCLDVDDERMDALSALYEFCLKKFRTFLTTSEYCEMEEEFEFAKDFASKADFYYEMFEKVKAYHDNIIFSALEEVKAA